MDYLKRQNNLTCGAVWLWTLKEEHGQSLWKEGRPTEANIPIQDREKASYHFYRSPNIIRIIKFRRFSWTGHVVRMEDSRNALKLLIGKHMGERPLEGLSVDGRMDLAVIWIERIDWISRLVVLNLLVPWAIQYFIFSLRISIHPHPIRLRIFLPKFISNEFLLWLKNL